MTKTRLEAFSDGVIAIIITIMVLELKPPHHADWESIRSLLPVFFSYVLSFIFIGIYWGNHHHLLHTVKHVNSKMIWANLHLLFWLSLIPFVTIWIGESGFGAINVAIYAGEACMCGVAYSILLFIIVNAHPKGDPLLVPLQKQAQKGIWSLVFYLSAIPAAFIHPAISVLFFITVSALWLIPDRNIAKAIVITPSAEADGNEE